jgi:hypothetical protein
MWMTRQWRADADFADAWRRRGRMITTPPQRTVYMTFGTRSFQSAIRDSIGTAFGIDCFELTPPDT